MLKYRQHFHQLFRPPCYAHLRRSHPLMLHPAPLVSKTITLFPSFNKCAVLDHPKGRTIDLFLDVAVCPFYIYPTMFNSSLVRFFLHQLATMCILTTNTYTHCHHTVFNTAGSFRCDIWLNYSPCFQIPYNHNVRALCQRCRSGYRVYYQTPTPEPATRGPDANQFGLRPAEEVDWEARWDSHQRRWEGMEGWRIFRGR